MGDQTTELEALERILEEREEASNLNMSILKLITRNFSEKYKIGQGGWI